MFLTKKREQPLAGVAHVCCLFQGWEGQVILYRVLLLGSAALSVRAICHAG